MIRKQLFGAVPVALLVLGNGAAKDGTRRSLTKATSWSILPADAS